MKALHLALAAALTSAALFSSNDADAAGHASGFGDKGQLILSADRLMPLFGYSHSSIDAANNNNLSRSENLSNISLLFAQPGQTGPLLLDVHAIPRIAADFTFINNLTVGLGLGFYFGLGGTDTNTQQNGATTVTTHTDAPKVTAIGVAPRVGYIIPLGEHLALWPRLGFAFYSVNGTAKETVANVTTTIESTDTFFSLDLDPQLAIIPVDNFFITVGVLGAIPITGNHSLTTTTGATSTETNQDTSLFHIGVNASIGGWVDLF